MTRFLLEKNDDLLFLDSKKSKNDVIENALKIAAFFKDNKINKAEIFLEDGYLFLCVLLGALRANCELTLLNSALSTCNLFAINENNIETLFSYKNSLKSEVLNKDSKIYLLTSGSSGKSKSIEKTLGQILLECDYIVDFLKFNSNHIFYGSVSHQHFYGLIFRIFVPLYAKAKMLAKQIKYPESILSIDTKNKVLISSPAVLKRLNEYENISILKDLYMVVTAGSALPKDVRRGLESKIFNKIIEIYGSTETGVIACNQAETFYPAYKTKIEICDEGGIDISSPWCETFHANDEVEIFDDGGFKLLGRSDRIIKLEDKRVSLINIEEFLLQSPLVKDCFIDKHPEINRLLALVVLTDEGIELFKKSGKKGINEALRDYLKQKYDSVFLVRYFKIKDHLPTNAQGKILKKDFKNAINPLKDFTWEEIYCDNFKAKFKTKSSVEFFTFVDHFPDIPLLPGFVQFGFVYKLAPKMGINLNKCSKIDTIKFSNFSYPNDDLELKLENKNSKLYFELKSSGKTSMKGRITLE